MVNFSFLSFVLVGILFLVVPTYQRGNLKADTIYSSSETFITIDTLEGGNAEVTNIKTDTVSFGNFGSVSLEALAITLDGSFALLEATNNIDIQSSSGTASLEAGNNLNINANNIGITSNGGSVSFNSEEGELNFVAGAQFIATSDSFTINTEVGGAVLNSQGGDIDINSSGDFIVTSSDEFNVRSTYDILFTTSQDISIASSEGEINIASLRDVNINAESSINFESGEDTRISFNAGDYIISNTGSFQADGSNELKIQSFTSSIKFNSFGSTSFSSGGDLTLQGETKGISLFSTGENTGIIQLASLSRSIYFTSQGNGDEETGLLANVDSFSGSVSGQSSLLSTGDGVIRSNGNIGITTGTAFQIVTENVNINSAQFDTTSGLDFALSANDINLYAFDDATSGNTLGYTEVSAINIQYNANQNVVIHGGDLSFTAGTGDVSLSADDIAISASRGDNSQHSITVNGTDFQYTGENSFILGEDVDIHGGSVGVTANDIYYKTFPLDPNFVRHTASDDITVSVDDSFVHNSKELTFNSFYAGGDSLESGIEFNSDFTISVSTANEDDITLVSKTYFDVNTQDSIQFDSFDADIDVTDSFSAYGDTVIVNANDFSVNAYSLYFDSLDSDPTTDDQIIEFSATSEFIFSTPRNENGDDSIFGSYTNITLDQTQLFFTGVEEGSFNTVTFNILSDDITLSSDDRENINFNINSLSLTANQLVYTGDSLTFSAPLGQANFDVDGSYTLRNDDRGLLIDSQGTFLLSAETESFYTPDNILIQSGSSSTLNTLEDQFVITADDSVDIYSSEGPVALASDAEFYASSDNNINFNTGDYQGNLFSANSEDIEFFVSDSASTSISSGNLDINVAEDATLNSGAISYVGAGVVTVKTVTYTLETGDYDVFGGNIDISSTIGNITFDATNLAINSTEASLAGQEIDRTTYEILFSSGDDLLILTEEDGEFLSKSDNLVIEAFEPENGQEGEILMAGSDLLFTSTLLNQFIQFTSGGLINITAANSDVQVASDSDFFINTANSAQFYAESIYQSMGQSITFDAQTNSCVNISHIGNTLQFVVESTIPKFYNDLEFQATDFVYFQAGDGAINVVANGASTKRQNEDGNSNGDLVFNQEISMSLRSRAELGNIVFEAQDDVVSFNAAQNTIIASLQQALFYTLTGQSYSAGTNTKFEAESGNVTMRAGHDYSITATGSLFFASTENTTVLAEDYIYIDATSDIDIISNSGDIFFNTYNKNDINVDGASIVSFTSGASGSRFIAQGDISTVTSTYDLHGARGINLLTNIGPILFSSLSSTSLASSEELFVKSGNNVFTTSTTSTIFSGKGVVFGSSAADVLMQSSEDVVVTSKTAILQSLGTSQSTRDRVAFNSEDITFQSLTAHVDATELVQIGKTTLPIVSITASGTEAISGVVINVAASSEIITEGKLVYSSVLGENDISATSGAYFDAEGSIEIANSNFEIYSLDGSVSLNANNNIDIAVANTAAFISDHFIKFSSTSEQVADGISFNFNVMFLNGHFLNTEATDLYSVEANTYILRSIEQGGGVRFEAPQGYIVIDARDDVIFDARAETSITAAVDSLFETEQLEIQTLNVNDLTPITFQAQNNFEVASDDTASFTGDYIAISTYGPGADINYSTDFLNINSSGSFISNSTLGSQFFSPNSDLLLTIDNFVTFNAANIPTFSIKGTQFTVESNIGSINAGADLTLSSTTLFNVEADKELSFIAANLIELDSPTVDLGFSADNNIFLSTTNDLNNLILKSDTLTAVAYSVNFRAGSEQEREDLRIIAENVVIGQSAAPNVQTSFIAQPTGLRIASPVGVTYPSITFGAEYITFNSTSAEEGFGGIYIGSPSLQNDIDIDADTNVVFLSEAARIITEVSDAITFQGDTMEINTNGLDSVIKFDSETTTDVDCTTFYGFSKDRTRIMSVASDLTLSSTTLGVEVNGPNDGDGNGIVVTGVYSATVTAGLTFDADADATRFTALTDIHITAPTVTFNGNTVLVKAQGGRENLVGGGPFYNAYEGPQLDFVGINIDTPDLEVRSPGQLALESAILYHSSASFGATVTGDVQYNANQNFEITTTGSAQLVVDSFLLNTEKGITLVGIAAGTDYQGQTVVVQAGNDDPDAKIIFSSPNIAFTPNANLILTSHDTIQYEATEEIAVDDTNTINFFATRGDILFRSISVTDVHVAVANPNLNVEIGDAGTTLVNLRVGRSIRHIDHWGLSFFQGNPAGSLVLESDANWAAGLDCDCPGNSCSCPNGVNRVVQLYTAFLNYGLIKIV